MDFSKKRKPEFFSQKLLFQLAGVAFFIIVVVLIFIDFSIYQKRRDLISQIDAYKKQIEDIQKNSQNLKEQIANSDNPEYLEKIAYEQLDQQKPGEKEVIFVVPQEQPKEKERAINPLTGWITGILQWLKNRF